MIQLALPMALLALLSVPLLAWLYHLRPQRRPAVISSGKLWREALRERQPASGMRRLLKNLSLLLLLLAATGMALSLADPRALTTVASQPALVVVVDVSASMQARESDGTRLQIALQRARELIDSRHGEARTALISSARNPRLVHGFDEDNSALLRALDGITATDEAGRPEYALRMATSLLGDDRDGRIVFLTDAAFDARSLDRRDNLSLDVVGSAQPNVAISRFALRPLPGGTGEYALFARIHNASALPTQVGAELVVAGAVARSLSVALPANGSVALNESLTGLGGEQVVLKIDADDALTVDNQAFGVLQAEAPLLVAVPPEFARSHLYLATALQAMPRVGLTSEQHARKLTHQADVQILSAPPAAPLEAGNYLLLDVPAPELGLSRGAAALSARTVPLAANALVAGLDLSGIAVDNARVLAAPPARDAHYLPLMRVPQGDVAAALLTPQHRLVIFSFDLARSTLPYRPQWPVLVQRALTWLAGQSTGSAPPVLLTGHSIDVPVATPRGRATLLAPGGDQRELPVNDGYVPVTDTHKAGFYTVTVGQDYRLFALNLTDRDESTLTPRARVQAAAERESNTPSPDEWPLWPLLCTLALAALAIEWWTGRHEAQTLTPAPADA